MIKVCAAIITYNPEIGLLLQNIRAIYNQVDHIYIWDNNSVNKIDIEKETEIFKSKVTFYFNSENYGIGKGLNHIFNVAMKEGYEWVLTMDQDSICSENMIEEYNRYIYEDKVAVICPFVLNNGKTTFEEYENSQLPAKTNVENSIECITSGSLTNIHIANILGNFNESLLVDCIDNEYYIRVLLSGYKIIRANRAYLVQQMGKAHEVSIIKIINRKKKSKILRKMSIVTVNNPYRLYLGNRNAKYIRKKYKKHDINYSFFYLFFLNLYFTFTYPISENRIEMWKSIIKGNIEWKKVKDIDGLDYSIFNQ